MLLTRKFISSIGGLNCSGKMKNSFLWLRIVSFVVLKTLIQLQDNAAENFLTSSGATHNSLLDTLWRPQVAVVWITAVFLSTFHEAATIRKHSRMCWTMLAPFVDKQVGLGLKPCPTNCAILVHYRSPSKFVNWLHHNLLGLNHPFLGTEPGTDTWNVLAGAEFVHKVY